MLSKEVLIKNFSQSWFDILKDFLLSDEFNSILREIDKDESIGIKVFPTIPNRFRAFRATPVDKLKVLVLGMDPYPTLGVATGLSFGISPEATRVPPSLKIIAREVEDSTGEPLKHFSLEHWASQGVLMLNAALTVQQSNPGSYTELWRPFTNYVLKQINDLDPICILLWGKDAKSYQDFFDSKKHNIISTCHPVYEQYSGGNGDFLGSNMFVRVNEWLNSRDLKEIDW